MPPGNVKLKRCTAPFLRFLSKTGNRIYPARNNNPVVISGSPRAGTTWIAETIARVYQSERILWEPLQDGNIEKDGLQFSKRPWIDETNTSSEIDEFFSSLLGAELANSHLLRLRKYPRNFFSLIRNQRLIIKFVRGNGVVGYLRRRFSIPKPLVIIRHPCAVVASQLNMGRWEDHPHVSSEIKKRRPDIAKCLNNETSLAERLTMTWGGDVLAAKENANYLNILYYEDLVLNGAERLRSTFQSWGWDSLPSSLHELLEQPSSSTHEWANLNSLEGKIGRWRNELNQEIVENILQIAHCMGIHDYSDDLLPESIQMKSD